MELKQGMSKETWKELGLFSLSQLVSARELSAIYNSLMGEDREDKATTLLGMAQ